MGESRAELSAIRKRNNRLSFVSFVLAMWSITEADSPHEIPGKSSLTTQQSRLSWGCVSAIDSKDKHLVADAHRADGKRFVVRRLNR
jgi:hypothetical protein